MSTSLVIRPSGVWNSRAPMVNYFTANREIGLHFNALLIATSRAKTQLKDSSSSALDSSWRNEKNGRVGAFAMLGYQKSLGKDSSGTRRKPTRDGLATDLNDSLQDLYQLVVVKVASLFETFVQCWALNYLLTRLEQNKIWSNGEQRLADRLSPILSDRLPNWSQIISGIPQIEVELRKLPHIFFKKNTTEEVTAPVSPVLNAYSVIEFWRNYRNLVVHRSGIVSTAFHERFAGLYDELRIPFGDDIPRLVRHTPLRFTDAVPRAMATTHYRAAARLAKRLAEFSSQRRGHVAAPGPEIDSLVGTHIIIPKPLLIKGDHAISYRWVSDHGFPATIAKQLHWEGRKRGMRPPPLPSAFCSMYVQ